MTTADLSMHLPLLRRMAAHMGRRLAASVDVRDLVQEAMLRLLSCTTGRPGWQLDEAYVSRHARGAMLDALRATDPLCRSERAALRRLAAAQASITARQGRCTAADLALETGMPLDEVHRLQMIDSHTHPMHAVPVSDALELAADTAPPDEQLQHAQSQALLLAAVAALPSPLREVTQARLAGETDADAAARLGMSPGMVRHWRTKALNTLRARLRPAMGM